VAAPRGGAPLRDGFVISIANPKLAVFFAALVARARRAFVEGPWLSRVERVMGVVLIGLGIRLALERR